MLVILTRVDTCGNNYEKLWKTRRVGCFTTSCPHIIKKCKDIKVFSRLSVVDVYFTSLLLIQVLMFLGS